MVTETTLTFADKKFNTYLSFALNKAINFDAFHIVDIQL